MSDGFRKIAKLPIWKEKYDKLGVSPQELYMRQNELCWLKATIDPDGKALLFCTDGEDEARTDRMLNPTIECVECMTDFTRKVIEESVKT